MAERGWPLCWDPIEAATVISTEAVSPSTSVFFATHAPLQIYRANMQDTQNSDGKAVNEQDVRDDFLTRATANGVLLMPVIGESGTGKSHLVRWIKEATTDDDTRRIIYLPKLQTSLRSVVTALLADAGGEEFDALRSEVDRMSELDTAGLQNRLLNSLQEAILASTPPPGLMRTLAAPDKLPALLLDPHVRAHMLGPGRLIPDLVESELTDRKVADRERQQMFKVTDLPIDIEDLNLASKQARTLLEKILVRPEFQTAAVDLLNDNLSTAVLSATLGVGRLQQAMLEIRRLYAQQDKEIVLLVEDFAVIQGLQRDLLDAIIEVGNRDGEKALAPMRTLMAVTRGYFERLVDTFLTRVRAASPHMYDLDRQFDENADGLERVYSFVGRYLNAVRLGRDRLDELRIRAGQETPNACDECPMRETCHSGFGATEEGHGLYPFNRSALRRAIHSVALPTRQEAIVPRAVLGQVVRNVLQDHARSLEEGTFPNERFREDFPSTRRDDRLLPGVQTRIEDADAVDAERRKLVLEFWGNAPSTVVNLAPEIHKAFSLPSLTVASSGDAEDQSPPQATENEKESERAPERDKPGGLTPSQERALRNIQEWQTLKATLSQGASNDLRRVIRDAVVRRCDWTVPIGVVPLAPELRIVWPPKSTTVSITGAAVEHLVGTDSAPIKLVRKAINAEFLGGLIEIDAGRRVGNAAHLRRLHALADSKGPVLKQKILEAREFTDPKLVLGLRAALLGAVLGGRAYPGQPEVSLVNVVFDSGAGWRLEDHEMRTPGWLEALRRHQEFRPDLTDELLRAFGYARGKTVSMIDLARLLPLLREAAANWSWSADGAVPDWAKRAVRGFAKVPELIDDQVGSLDRQLQVLRELLPADERGAEVVKAVIHAYQAGFNIHEVPTDSTDFKRMFDGARNIDWAAIDRLERSVVRWRDLPSGQARSIVSLEIVGRDHGPDLADATAFLRRADAWLRPALESLDSRLGAEFADATKLVERVSDKWKQIRSRGRWGA